MIQNELLLTISKIIPNNKSLIAVIASILDISYASAHRRVTNSAKLSIDEAVKIATHFNLSLDTIFSVGDKNIIPVSKTHNSKCIVEIEKTFRKISDHYLFLTKQKGVSTIYCAQDLHITNAYEYHELSRFHIYSWLKLLGPNFKNRVFSDFKIPAGLKTEYIKIGKYQKQINNTEIWDITTINSTLKQVLYYLSINQLSKDEALLICQELKSTILSVRAVATPDSNFKLYYNELVLMNNQFFVKTLSGCALYIQHTGLDYFKTTDKSTCEQTSEYLDRLLENCKLINTSTEKEKDFFFNKMIKKIDSLNEHILGQRELDF